MEFKEKHITLKNGRTALFRSPQPEDAEAMLDYIKTACGETDFLARYPEEWSMSIEQEVAWVNQRLTAPKGASITCFIDGKVVGNCEVMGKSGIKMGHRATVAIAILRKYWGLGIGSAMFEEMIGIAQEHGTEIMELEFIEGNDRAKHLYEKYGFRVIGERPRAIRLKDGRYLSEFLMQKKLEGRDT